MKLNYSLGFFSFFFILVPGGLKFENSVQTSLVQAGDTQELRLESLTKNLFINAANGLDLNSYGNNIRFQSLMEY